MFDSHFLQEELNRLMADYLRLPEGQRENPTTKKAKELNARRSGLNRAKAGWGALCAWVELDADDMERAASAKALLGASLDLLQGDLRDKALLSVGTMALRRDNPTAWLALKEGGFDPRAALLEATGRQPGRGWVLHQDPPQPGWLAMAVDRGRWRMGEMLMGQPEGKLATPTAEEEVGEMEMLGSLKETVDEGDWKDAKLEMGFSVAQRWQRGHPLLVLWSRDEADGTKSSRLSQRADGFEARLVAAGFGPVWASPGFEAAAVDLALRGMEPALSACAARGAKPSAAAEFGMGGGALALEGGVLRSTKDESALWERIKAWADAVEPGFSEAAELRAAQGALAGLAYRDWRMSGTDSSVAVKCAARLAADAGADPEKDAERASEWTQWCVQLAELGTRRGADADWSKVREALESGSRAIDMAKARAQGLSAPARSVFKI